MHLKSKADPIDVLVIKQNAGTSPVSLTSQCQLSMHNNTMTSAYNTTPVILEGEAVSHLHKHGVCRTANSGGVSIVSQSTETEVTSAIGGSIVTPVVAQDNIRISDLLSSNEISEMSQDDGKLIQNYKNCTYVLARVHN